MGIKITYCCDVCGKTYEEVPNPHKLIGEWEVPEDWQELALRSGRESYPMYHICYDKTCQETVSKHLNEFFNKLAMKRFSKEPK